MSSSSRGDLVAEAGRTPATPSPTTGGAPQHISTSDDIAARIDGCWSHRRPGSGPKRDLIVGMRLQFADPSDHPHLGLLPFATDLDDSDLPHMHGVLGLHRHVVRLVELGSRTTGRPTSSRSSPTTSPGASTGCCASWPTTACRRHSSWRSSPGAPATARAADHRHLDYSLPYRTLLSGAACRSRTSASACSTHSSAC